MVTSKLNIVLFCAIYLILYLPSLLSCFSSGNTSLREVPQKLAGKRKIQSPLNPISTSRDSSTNMSRCRSPSMRYMSRTRSPSVRQMSRCRSPSMRHRSRTRSPSMRHRFRTRSRERRNRNRSLSSRRSLSRESSYQRPSTSASYASEMRRRAPESHKRNPEFPMTEERKFFFTLLEKCFNISREK
jgi:hypothetical protein